MSGPRLLLRLGGALELAPSTNHRLSRGNRRGSPRGFALPQCWLSRLPAFCCARVRPPAAEHREIL